MTSLGTLPDAPFALVRFRKGQGPNVAGVFVDGRVREVVSLATPDAFNELLATGPVGWDVLAEEARAKEGWTPVEEVALLAPVQPRQVIQTGANYRTHVIDLVVAGRRKDDPRPVEQLRAWAADLMDRRARDGLPYFFIGLPAAVVGHDVPLVLPAYSNEHDWELELAVVIGREAFRVSREEASEHIAGYTIVNDVTTRDLVFRQDMKEIGTDWYRAKNAPGFLPTGPFLVPAPYVADAGALRVVLELNGEVMQDATTDDLLFDIPALISAASQNMPLLPGDLLLTGSPAGNGIAHGRLLRDGDVMVGAIQGLGAQRVECVAESAH